MRSGLRVGAVAAALAIASYALITAQHGAEAETAAQDPPSEVTAADTKTTLPAGVVSDVLVDDAHDQVFISMPENNSILVADFAGTITKTITGLAKPSEMVLSPDGSTVYAAQGGASSIARIDTSSFNVDQISLTSGLCAYSVTYTGGKVWFSHADCSTNSGHGVGVLDPATGEPVTGVIAAEGLVRALPDRAERLVAFDGSSMWVYDVSGDSPAKVAAGYLDGSRSNCRDAALIAGGDQLVTACGAPYKHEVFNTADLTAAPAIASDAYPNAVAVTPDGDYVAAGIGSGWYDPDVYIANVSGGTPGTPVRTYEFGYNHELITRSLAFSDTGTLFAVEEDWPNPSALHVLRYATKYPTAIAVAAPKAVKYHGTVSATGTMTDGPGATTVTLQRTDRSGTHDLGSVAVAGDGTFSFTDTPNVTGPVTYQVGYAGDDTHQPAQATATVIMRPLPYDVNADGYAETLLGAAGEDLGTASNAGQFHLLYGGAAGVTGTGSKAYHQDSPGVPGFNESGDQFGYSNASGDFNADGYADVAVSAGAENVGSVTDSGQVLVFYGSATGLRTDNVGSLTLSNTYWSSTKYVYFGDALAAGDFDGDGRDDLAIGAAGTYSGNVFVSRGGDSGLSANYQVFSSDTSGVPGTAGESDLFGYALAAGDANGDGRADLAVGAIFDWEDRGWSTGSVTMLYGGDAGLSGTGAQRFSKDTAGVPGSGGSFNEANGDTTDQFGNSIALADFTGDGKADLAVGAAGAPVTGTDGKRKADAGTVTVLYSDGSKIGTTGAVQVTQSTSGMPGDPGSNDFFGGTLAAGDTNGDGKAELAIFSPGDTYVTVVPGGASGLTYSKAKGWTQNTTGIPGTSETGDYWGDSLRFADPKGTGYAALIVGADGENSGQGAFTVIYSTSSGLTATGSKYFDQNSDGVPGTAEKGDFFGTFF